MASALLGFVVGVSMVSAGAQSNRQYFNARSAANPAQATQPPYSGAVAAGNALYLSGVTGRGDTAEAAATAALNSFQASLKAAGMTMDDLVQVQVFTPDVANYDAFNKVYRGMFKAEFPARAFLGSGQLLQGATFEIIGIAVKR
jgi:enamine deaminase RidA (YjgF/YER057c/UK114 family)